jgi:hypothetical protein
MESEKTTFNPEAPQPTGVQHDSETPLPKKPSFLYLVSTTIGVLLIILLATSAYHGITH